MAITSKVATPLDHCAASTPISIVAFDSWVTDYFVGQMDGLSALFRSIRSALCSAILDNSLGELR